MTKNLEIEKLVKNQLNEQKIHIETNEDDLMSKEFKLCRHRRKRTTIEPVDNTETVSVFNLEETTWLI